MPATTVLSMSADENAPRSRSFPTTAAYLEWLSMAVMEAHTTGDDHILHEHLAPDFEMVNGSKHECPVPQAGNLKKHLENCERFKQENPSWKITATNVTVNMQKGSTSAEVWMTLRGSQSGEDVRFNRESISILHWRRRAKDGMWLCYRHRGIRGGGDMLSWDIVP